MARPRRSELERAAILHLVNVRRMGLRQAARLLGVPRSTVADWLKSGAVGLTNPRLRLVAQYAIDQRAMQGAEAQEAWHEFSEQLREHTPVLAELILADRPPVPEESNRPKTERPDVDLGRQEWNPAGSGPPAPDTPADMAPIVGPGDPAQPGLGFEPERPPLKDKRWILAFHRYLNLIANDVPHHRAVKAIKNGIDHDFQVTDAQRDRAYEALDKHQEPVNLAEGDWWFGYDDLVLLANWSAGKIKPPEYVQQVYDMFEPPRDEQAVLSGIIEQVFRASYLEGINAQLVRLGYPPVDAITDPGVLDELSEMAEHTAQGINNTYTRDLGGEVYTRWIELQGQKGRQMSRQHLISDVQQWAEKRADWKATQISTTEANRAYNQAVRDFTQRNAEVLAAPLFDVTPDACVCDACLMLVRGGPYSAAEASLLELPLHPHCVHYLVPHLGTPTGELWVGEGTPEQIVAAAEWNPVLHPRGEHGFFTHGIGGVDKVLESLHNGRTTHIDPDGVPALMDELGHIERNVDLGHLQVNGPGNEHCFTHHLRDIPRAQMPQVPGTTDGLGDLLDALAKRGAKGELKWMDPRELRMTQSQLDGRKVARMYEDTRKEPWPENNVIIVSREGAILDGHHRWASAAVAAMAGSPHPIHALQVDLPIDELLQVAGTVSIESRGLAASEVLKFRAAFDPLKHPHDVLGRWAKVGDVEAGQHASRLREAAIKHDEQVTSDMRAVAGNAGGHMQGLDFRIKSQGSLSRKIATDAKVKGISAKEAADQISDVLRYTMIFEPNHYAQDSERALQGLVRRGYRVERSKNFWTPGNIYKGVNVKLRAPDGHPVELQFHTKASFQMKENTLHHLYEEARLPSTPPDRRAALEQQMRSLSAAVPMPPRTNALGQAIIGAEPVRAG